jgi:hypothetical protein
MTKTIMLIAALVASSPVFAAEQTHPQGVIDTLLTNADAVRCQVIRNDLPDEMLLSNCDHEPGK